MISPSSPEPSFKARAGALAIGALVDLVGFGGAFLIVAGIDQMHRPAAFITTGLLLIGVSVLGARRIG